MRKDTKRNRKNIVLIGMPGVGKSTIGVILAKYRAMDFIDTDLLIQRDCHSVLQHIIDLHGYMALRKIEEDVISALSVENTVIATGGSAVYSSKAMNRLQSNGVIVYLRLTMAVLIGRLGNYSTRGIACSPYRTFRSLFSERTKLYRQYREYTINCGVKIPEEISTEIIGKVNRTIT